MLYAADRCRGGGGGRSEGPVVSDTDDEWMAALARQNTPADSNNVAKKNARRVQQRSADSA